MTASASAHGGSAHHLPQKRAKATFVFLAAVAVVLVFMLFLYGGEDFAFYLIGPSIIPSIILNNFSARNFDQEILILDWTTFFGRSWADMRPKIFDSCPHRCRMTSNRSLINKSSAVLFHIRDMNWNDVPPSKYRTPNRYYVFLNWESPTNTYGFDARQRNFFNLTMTYRTDSDIYFPYAMFRRISTTRPTIRPKWRLENFTEENLRNLVAKKNKFAAWFVSNCQTASRREDVVNRLRKFINVDVYGRCGDLHCDRVSTGPFGEPDSFLTECDKLLTSTYKFYISFENSLCRDYVTEKFLDRLSNDYIIPIVMERKMYASIAFNDAETLRALNRAFIAVDDFPSIEELTDYLKYLDKNDTAYMEYFSWRKTHEVVQEPWCELCRVASEKNVRKTYADMNKWWTRDACHEPRIPPEKVSVITQLILKAKAYL